MQSVDNKFNGISDMQIFSRITQATWDKDYFIPTKIATPCNFMPNGEKTKEIAIKNIKIYTFISIAEPVLLL